VTAGETFHAYLLGQVEFGDALRLQRRLIYDVTGGAPPCFVVCEHPPLITVGREGSRAHFRFDPESRPWSDIPVRFVNRAGGCWLHGPGQLAFYPILPLRRLGLGLRECLARLQAAVVKALTTPDLAPRALGATEVAVGDRPVACLGLAVQDWTTWFGGVLNVNPDVEPFRHVRTGPNRPPMTSLQRETRKPVRPSRVREGLVEAVAEAFGGRRIVTLTDHVVLERKAVAHALSAPG
jgi:lipoyl(octanoyl) transferase